MAFSLETISTEDRTLYRLAEFERGLFMVNPQPTWAIDRERDLFLRVIRPAARGSEPGDPDAVYEKDFQFHWKGSEFLVCTRLCSARELTEFSGEILPGNMHGDPEARVLRYYLRHLGEISRPSGQAASALLEQRQQLLADLREALAFGTVARTPEEAATPRQVILKIAPDAEVPA